MFTSTLELPVLSVQRISLQNLLQNLQSFCKCLSQAYSNAKFNRKSTSPSYSFETSALKQRTCAGILAKPTFKQLTHHIIALLLGHDRTKEILAELVGDGDFPEARRDVRYRVNRGRESAVLIKGVKACKNQLKAPLLLSHNGKATSREMRKNQKEIAFCICRFGESFQWCSQKSDLMRQLFTTFIF